MTPVSPNQRAPRWSIVVPVKRLGAAKSRLARYAGARRADLALAVATDTVAAAITAPGVASVIVVTDDPVASAALRALGAHIAAGEPGTGLNAALVHGAAAAAALDPGAARAALSADLPALRPAELGRVLDAAARYPTAFLADSPGIGTTLYSATPGALFAPAFEGASRRRHRDGGAAELRPEDVDSVRRDVDTPDDLHEAALLGLGPHTAAVLAALGMSGHDAARVSLG